MSLFTITEDKSNKDIPSGMSVLEARRHYHAMSNSFVSKLSKPVVQTYGDRYIFRGDVSQSSLKGYGAEQLVAECKEDVLVYCAPRVGMAMDAIATLAKIYDKKCVFFCPASGEPSKHQKALLAYGADLRFIKIAAMPTLNHYARKWAEKHGAKYLPFGLANTPLVTAGIVSLGTQIAEQLDEEPSEIWMSVSTGTAIRAFQIAWPEALCRGIVVARNMHNGEIGHANLWSATTPFLKDAPLDKRPPFPSTPNYDAKCWEDFDNFGAKGSIFINVGTDDKVNKFYDLVKDIPLDSQRVWHDMRDLERGL
tara:strand:+ start:1412 stop:2338 length:927 start_codon:yes stop_codon:yes gene_type:complete